MFMRWIFRVSFLTHLISTLCFALSNLTIYTNQHYINVTSYEGILICGLDNLTIHGKSYINLYQYKVSLKDIYINIYLAQDLPYFRSFICKLHVINCTLYSNSSCTCLGIKSEFIMIEINLTVNKIFSQNNVFVLMDPSSGVDFESNRIKFPVISDGKIKLFPYNQSDSTTECRVGLVLEMDKLIVYGMAKFNDIFENGTISFRYSVSKKLLCKMSVQNCTISTRRQCYCVVQERNSLQMVLNVTALWSLRKSELTVLLMSGMNDYAIESQAVTLPDIFIYACLQLKLNDCPKIVAEGEVVQCTCELDLNMKSTSSLEYSLKWKGNKDNHNDRTTLSFTANRPSVEYICLFNSTDKEKLIRYTPFIIAKPENVTCNQDLGENGEFNITCVTTKMYPEASCVFKLCHIETKVLKTLPVMYRNIKILDNPDYYRLRCTTTIHVQQPGVYNLAMSLIAYHSGLDPEHLIHFTVNETFTFVKAP